MDKQAQIGTLANVGNALQSIEVRAAYAPTINEILTALSAVIEALKAETGAVVQDETPAE